jgi:alpha-D-xyloside xylohydrolase
MIRTSCLAVATLLGLLSSGGAYAQTSQIVLDRDGGTIVLEPYAPNIIRVTLSLLKEPATAAPGYGFVANPSTQGWSRQQNAGDDVYRSDRLVVTVAANRPHKSMQSELDIAKYFNGSAPPAHITVATPAGKKLAEMTDWSMSVPNHKDANASVLNDKRPSDPPFYQVGATFVSPDDEHYYGLGQNHEGFLDHRGRRIECWHNYTATAAPSICVPFLVTNKGYGVVWDNPSKTVIDSTK